MRSSPASAGVAPRGWRGLTEIPAIVRDWDEQKRRLEAALVENLQRDDLNPMEEADRRQAPDGGSAGLTQERRRRAPGQAAARAVANLLAAFDAA